MWTRRYFIKLGFLVSIFNFVLPPINWVWAKTRKILPFGFSREILKDMHPEEIDNRNLDIDPIEKFGTMGTTDIFTDLNKYRLNITGKVKNPISLSFEQILKYPQLSETVLLICPGFFAYNALWTGVSLKPLIQKVQPEKGVKYFEVKGADGKNVRIPLTKIDQKKVFLAYKVNGERLPQKHGFPLRLVYEDAYGSEWIKFVEEIVFS